MSNDDYLTQPLEPPPRVTPTPERTPDRTGETLQVGDVVTWPCEYPPGEHLAVVVEQVIPADTLPRPEALRYAEPRLVLLHPRGAYEGDDCYTASSHENTYTLVRRDASVATHDVRVQHPRSTGLFHRAGAELHDAIEHTVHEAHQPHHPHEMTAEDERRRREFQEAADRAAAELQARIQTVHERRPCAACGAHTGQRCVSLAKRKPGTEPRIIKTPHEARIRADGIALR